MKSNQQPQPRSAGCSPSTYNQNQISEFQDAAVEFCYSLFRKVHQYEALHSYKWVARVLVELDKEFFTELSGLAGIMLIDGQLKLMEPMSPASPTTVRAEGQKSHASPQEPPQEQQEESLRHWQQIHSKAVSFVARHRPEYSILADWNLELVSGTYGLGRQKEEFLNLWISLLTMWHVFKPFRFEMILLGLSHAAQNTLKSIVAEVEGLKESVVTLSPADKHASEVDGLVAQVSEYDAELRRLIRQSEQDKQALSSYEAEIASHKDTIKDLKEAVRNLECSNNELHQAVRRLAKDNLYTDADFKELQASYEKRVEDLKAQIEVLQEDQAQLRKTNLELCRLRATQQKATIDQSNIEEEEIVRRPAHPVHDLTSILSSLTDSSQVGALKEEVHKYRKLYLETQSKLELAVNQLHQKQCTLEEQDVRLQTLSEIIRRSEVEPSWVPAEEAPAQADPKVAEEKLNFSSKKLSFQLNPTKKDGKRQSAPFISKPTQASKAVDPGPLMDASQSKGLQIPRGFGMERRSVISPMVSATKPKVSPLKPRQLNRGVPDVSAFTVESSAKHGHVREPKTLANETTNCLSDFSFQLQDTLYQPAPRHTALHSRSPNKENEPTLLPAVHRNTHTADTLLDTLLPDTLPPRPSASASTTTERLLYTLLLENTQQLEHLRLLTDRPAVSGADLARAFVGAAKVFALDD